MLHVGVPTERSKDFKGSMKRLFERLGPERSKLWGVMVFALLGVALSVSGPKVLGHATNLVFEGVFRKLKGGEGIDFHALAMTALVALLLYLASYALGYAQAWMLAGVVQRTMRRLRDDVERSAKRIARLEQKLDQKLAQRSAATAPPAVPALPEPKSEH